ncbi:ABC transporter ATP-binding protein [Clostridium baratii]|uniref:ABC transporter ATP-binding protein n=1 Tax=Clostridium baratii TaxID=1561 RepID=UPI002908976F|nr:ABC transporter ATP-binding protein [Clostridium baratii]MDU4912368.1 ABC transporter ATP-binding protein [Clostridium baratii]
MIQISNLSVFYGGKKEKVKAVGPINFKCNDNDICAIIGPSGCGKTTLLNVLSGVNKDYEGEVLLNDEKLNPHLHKIGFIPQDFGLLPWKTVEENCLLPFKIKGEKIDKDILDKMDLILKRLNIYDLRKKHPNKLSGGQRQRVSIARSFLMNPDLLLMDEAFSALDAIIKEEAEELFLDVWSSNKISTFFVTHSIDEAIYMGKKIIIMSNTPGVISEVIENDLFNNKNYKEDIRYLKLFSKIKNLIKKEWDNK